MEDCTVFVVSDNTAIRDSLAELIASSGLRPEAYACLEAWIGGRPLDWRGCLVLDASRSNLAAAQRHGGLAGISATCPVLLLIDRGDVPSAVRAIRDGAVDVLEKPCRDQTLLERIRRAAAAAQDSSKAG